MGVPNILKQYHTSNITRLVDTNRTSQFIRFINLIHFNNRDSYITFFTKNNAYIQSQYSFKPQEIDYNTLQSFCSLKDTYVSVNSFCAPIRRKTAIRQINALWVDLDFYKIPSLKKYKSQEIIKKLYKNNLFKDLEPSFFVDSGNGLYIFYLLEDVPKMALRQWEKTIQALNNKFVNYGADLNAVDVARVLRVPGTINSKTGRVAKLITYTNDPKRYKLTDITNLLLGELKYTKKEWEEIKKQRQKELKIKAKTIKKPLLFSNIYNLNYNRMLDIVKIIEMRKNITGEHKRNFLIYLFSLFYMYYKQDPEGLLKAALEQNKKFATPLSKTEVKYCIKSSINAWENYKKVIKKYNKNMGSLAVFLHNSGCIIYSNKTLVEKLELTRPEIQKLNTIIDSVEVTKRKQKRNKEYYKTKLEQQGKKTKKQQTEELQKKILALKKQGLKNVEILNMLDIGSIRTLQRHIKTLKNNGLLK